MVPLSPASHCPGRCQEGTWPPGVQTLRLRGFATRGRSAHLQERRAPAARRKRKSVFSQWRGDDVLDAAGHS